MNTDIEPQNISKEDFAAYERIRQSGVLNMMSPQVQELADIDRDTHWAIIKHYPALCAKWPDIRDLTEKGE